MENSLLNMLGFDPAYIIIGIIALILILMILMIVDMVQTSKMKRKYAIFMKGGNAKSLENTLIKRLEELEALQESDAKNIKDIKKLYAQHRLAVQKVGMVKYDAFDEMGGKLSFSLALLNQDDTGIVMNIVHTREGCYSYIKDIIQGNSVIVLTEEEKQAIQNAISGEKITD